MNRRAYLRTSGGAFGFGLLAGCLALESPFGGYRVTEHDIDERSPIQYGARVVDGGYDDPDTPLTVEVELTNRYDETVGYYERRTAQFFGVPDETGRFSLVPAIWADSEDYEFTGTCWRRVSRFSRTEDLQAEVLEPDESVSEPLVLLAREECPEEPPEEITFTTGYVVEDYGRFQWGFSLRRGSLLG